MSGPRAVCRCECGYVCNRRCGLDIDDCMDSHYRRDCDHVWDGPVIRFDSGGTVTCSKCPATCIDHDMAVGP